MSAGDPRVETYMVPVYQALERVRDRLDPNDRTAIYNRAYEAVWKAINDTEKVNPKPKPIGML